MPISGTSKRPAGIPPVLIVSASDSSGAAGMQVDIRTAEKLGVPVRCAVTAITVQGEKDVFEVFIPPGALIERSIREAARDKAGVSAVKIGVLAAASTVEAVSRSLAKYLPPGVPIVVDPVMKATSGGELLNPEGIQALCMSILPLCTLITPNHEELDSLSSEVGTKRREKGDISGDARILREEGVQAVLVTGGRGSGDDCTDILYINGEIREFSHPRVTGPSPRGTGCALSTAITCQLAKGHDLPEAVDRGIDTVYGLIAASKYVGGQRLLFPSWGIVNGR